MTTVYAANVSYDEKIKTSSISDEKGERMTEGELIARVNSIMAEGKFKRARILVYECEERGEKR